MPRGETSQPERRSARPLVAMCVFSLLLAAFFQPPANVRGLLMIAAAGGLVIGWILGVREWTWESGPAWRVGLLASLLSLGAASILLALEVLGGRQYADSAASRFVFHASGLFPLVCINVVAWRRSRSASDAEQGGRCRGRRKRSRDDEP